MSGFSADWLALREGADAAARDSALTERLARRLARRRPLRVLDLGAGIGANLRYLAPRLGGVQHWRLIDNDQALLAQLPDALSAWAHRVGHHVAPDGEGLRLQGKGFSARVDGVCRDLAGDPQTWFPRDTDLVTASALLDLVSREWLDALASRIRGEACAALFALSYDGRIAWEPGLPDDPALRDALNRHQRRDKGLGTALGPEAAAYAAARLAGAGYAVDEAPSDWRLDETQDTLQQTLAEGWAEAATTLSPDDRPRIERWLAARRDAIRQGRSRLRVGHRDTLALMPAGDSQDA
jgi:SAM-dependent methyltransferase